MDVEIVEGWTEAIAYQLFADSVAVDLTGKTVALRLYDKANVLVSSPPAVTATDDPAGKISFLPTNLVAASSPYKLRFVISPDGYMIPNGTKAARLYVARP